MKAEELYKKEFGDADSVPKESVIRLLKNFARVLQLERDKSLQQPTVSSSSLSFEQCLLEEFLVNTENYPREYHKLFKEKFERAKKRFKEQSGN